MYLVFSNTLSTVPLVDAVNYLINDKVDNLPLMYHGLFALVLTELAPLISCLKFGTIHSLLTSMGEAD